MSTTPPNPDQPISPINPQKSSSEKTPPPLFPSSEGGFSNMTEFMKLFTPEERKKFMNILVQNISRDVERASKRYLEELKRQKREIESGERD